MRVFDVVDHGADPTGRRDSAEAFAETFRAACAGEGPSEVVIPPGSYHLYPERAERRDLYVSNTVGADERYRTKTIAMLVEGARDLTVTGKDAHLVLHGRQTALAVIDSRNVRWTGFSVDYHAPSLVEARVVAAGPNWRRIAVPADVTWRIDGTHLRWEGERGAAGPYWTGQDGLDYTQVHDPRTGRTRRCDNPLFTGIRAIRDDLTIEYDHPIDDDTGLVYQMRPTVRDHPGMFVWESEGVVLDDLDIHYLHGFGILGQLSRDLTISDVRFLADPATGRHTASYADFVNLSNVGGQVRIADCVFAVAHDDAVNVHGTYLVVKERTDDRTVVLEYRHPETAGFPAFHPGDEIEFVERASRAADTAIQARVERVDGPNGRDASHDPRTMTVTVDRPLPPDLVEEEWAAENISYSPDVSITGNLITGIPTRGVLLTARGHCVIEGNTFDDTGMAGILVSGDANDWFESGPVRDLTIRDNEFRHLTAPAVLVEPADKVHSGIAVEDNRFVD
ncbi:Right handed beta helix region [Asanoa hainanensis]|uniref:Right handed beta helix region n=1 Tax=Asanoa hainanensis TaxID=560556 RepID=A0A239PFC5_9ACTN|nr:right-handed parallel beta-helix repeat-containing protein [Asanoa hainanensis]SNT65806.1 Right handed beta helix region [Asanoa hainanensis]